MSRYAERTEVSSDRSRNEIEKTLRRYGASQFAYGWDRTGAVIGFTMEGRQVRFVLPLPDPADAEFTQTPTGRARSSSAAETEYERAVRQRWRALALVVKAKLEAVAAGIVTFEQEFGMFICLPDGRTLGELAIPQIDDAYRAGVIPPLLAIAPGDSGRIDADESR